MNASRRRPAEFTPSGAFAAHGRVRTELRGRIAISHVRGPWNAELVQEWVAAFGQKQDLLKAMPAQGGHAALIVVEQSALATADAIALMRKVTQYSMERYALRAGALVLPEGVEGRQLAPRAMAPIWDGLVPYCVVDTLDEALAWCLQTLAQPASG